MFYTTVFVVFSLIVIKWLFSKSRGDLDLIPGESRGWWQLLTKKQPNPYKMHLHRMAQQKKYGPISRLESMTDTIVVVSDFKLIYEILVKRGKEFGGRPTTFRLKEILGNSGILVSYNPDATWKTLRKVSQKHLKQFGDGLSRLESVIGIVAEDMFEEFQNNTRKPLNPQKIIFDTALNSIAFLITGQRTHIGDPIVEKMREYESMFLSTLEAFSPKSFKLLNTFPWLKYLGFDNWKPYQRFKKLHEDIWQIVKDMNDANPEAESICKVLMSHVSEGDGTITETDAQSASLSLLFAGVTTTSATFYTTLNILAHKDDVQKQMYEEILKIRQENDVKSLLAVRNKMSYTRAVLFEILRFNSVVSDNVHHRTVQETELAGLKIPANIAIIPVLYYLHFDDQFWGDPYVFRPERYLDDEGEVVPADHPNRTHLMPFGAGTRVCLGESLALTRLFIWVTTFVERFKVKPAPGNEASTIDPKTYMYTGVLRPEKYEVTLEERE